MTTITIGQDHPGMVFREKKFEKSKLFFQIFDHISAFHEISILARFRKNEFFQKENFVKPSDMLNYINSELESKYLVFGTCPLDVCPYFLVPVFMNLSRELNGTLSGVRLLLNYIFKAFENMLKSHMKA